MDHANANIADLLGRMDGTLDSIHATVNNANGMVTNANGMVSDVRHRKGSMGMLLNDEATAATVKSAIEYTQRRPR